MLIIAYVLIINFCGFVLCGWDKRKAVKHQWRVPERDFFILALVGAGPGILAGMYTFRHKTRHRKFTIGIPVMILIDCTVIFTLWKIWR